CMRGIQFPLTF
nr:immunoglobulin light chain junction region [Macaca mulatta]